MKAGRYERVERQANGAAMAHFPKAFVCFVARMKSANCENIENTAM